MYPIPIIPSKHFDARNRDDLNQDIVLDEMKNANFIFFSGGSPTHLFDSIQDSKFSQELKNVENRGIIAGCSAGAMIMGEKMIKGTGLNYIANTIVIPHYGESIQLPKSVGGFVLPRSGLASKHLIAPINSPGLIDPGYTGELMVPLMNYSDESYIVTKHERVAQLVVITTGTITFDEVSNLDVSDRSKGGFGSTGKN